MENVVKIQHFNRFSNLIYFGYLLLFYAVVGEMGIHPIEGGGETNGMCLCLKFRGGGIRHTSVRMD